MNAVIHTTSHRLAAPLAARFPTTVPLRRRMLIACAIAFSLLLLASAPSALAFGPESTAVPDTADISDVKVTEHPGAMIPDLPFVDETGAPVHLGQYFTGKRPVVLQLGYYGCPMLCGLISQGTVASLKSVSFVPGKDYDFVFVSIDPSEKPPLALQKKQSYLQEFGREGASGWHFLTGKQENIAKLARTVGFKYKWVESAGQFAHPATVMMCMPNGKLSRYLYGVRFDPTTMRESLVEASNGKIGTPLDQIFLTCFHYDGHQGKYAFAAISIMRTGGVIMMILVAVYIIRMLRREQKLKEQGEIEDE